MNQAESSDAAPQGLPVPVPTEPHCWYYEKSEIRDSPSSRDGSSTELEIRYRREGARFIINLGAKMGMNYKIMATAVVFFHRFYMFRSFKEFPRYVTGCCCFFLAGKVEETPKKCFDIIKTARTLLTDAQFAQFGDNPKEEVMTLEKILLKTIRFDFKVDHPYPYLLKYAKCLKGDKSKLEKIVQMAWTFINDSFSTTLCLEWEPEVVAVAVIYLAAKLGKFRVKDWIGRSKEHKHWWDMYVSGLTIAFLEDICHQILDLYSNPESQNQPVSPPPSPTAEATHKLDEAASSHEAPLSAEVPLGLNTPRPQPEDIKRRTPKSANRNDSLESSKVLSDRRNSSNEAMMHGCPSISEISIYSLATENQESYDKREIGSLTETVGHMYPSSSSSEAYMSQNVPSPFAAASSYPNVATDVHPLALNDDYMYFAPRPEPDPDLPQDCCVYAPPELLKRYLAPPKPPTMLIPPPYSTLPPPPMQFPGVFAPQHRLPPPPPPPQSVPAASIPQFAPPPLLHARGPGRAANLVPQPSSVRLPPPLVRDTISPTDMTQAYKPSCPSSLSNPQNPPTQFLSQNSPHHGIQKFSQSKYQPDFLQNLPPTVPDMTGSMAHCSYQGYSNPVHRFNEGRNNPPGSAPTFQQPQGSVSASSPYDNNVYPHFRQETESPASYSGISHKGMYSDFDQNFEPRPRSRNQYVGELYMNNIPPHLRFTSYPSPPGHYQSENRSGSRLYPSAPGHYQSEYRSGSHHQQPVFPNEMFRGPPNGRSQK